ncbi:MAG: cytochrome b N-terminal domain-containing protein [Planctomycetota bacterium]
MGAGDRFRKALDRIYQSPLWKSIFRHGWPDTAPNRALAVLSNVFLHLHPTQVKGHALKLRYTWCMGGLAFFLFLHLVVSGVFLMFYYRPTPEYAYADIVALREDVPLGMFMRNVHRWAAHGMVILVWLHMLRVFLTGSYKKPREFNWVVGVALLVLTLLLSFTGYLLPWDQISLWGVTVGTNMAGAAPLVGHEGPGASLLGSHGLQIIHAKSDIKYLLLGGSSVGPAALLRFYVLHCIFLPLLAAVMMAVHFWRIRKDGFSGPL